MSKTNLKFYKGTAASLSSINTAAGAIWFNTENRTINVRTATAEGGLTWETYTGLVDATFANGILTITKAKGDSLQLNLSDVASAKGLADLKADLFGGVKSDGTKVEESSSVVKRLSVVEEKYLSKDNETVKSVNNTSSAGVALALDEAGELSVKVTGGSVAENDASVVTGGTVYNAIQEAVLSKNISTDGEYIEIKNNEISASDKLKNAVTAIENADEKYQPIGEYEAAGEAAKAEGAAKAYAKGLVYNTVDGVDVAKFDAAGAAEGAAAQALADAKTYVKGVVGTLPTTGEGDDLRTMTVAEAIADAKGYTDNQLGGYYTKDDVDSAISDVASLVTASTQFLGVFASVAEANEAEPGKGDIMAIAGAAEDSDDYAKNGKEFIYDGENWIELGDTTAEQKRLTAVEELASDNADAIAVLNGGVEENGSVAKAVNDAKVAVKNELTGELKEGDAETLAALNNRIDAFDALTDTIESALQSDDITTGTANGTILVGETEVAVKGLGSAAFTASTAYATAEQGAKADSALQSINIAGETLDENNTELKVDKLKEKLGLGSAAYVDTDAFDAIGAADAAYKAALGKEEDDVTKLTLYGVRKYADSIVHDSLS